MTEITRVPLQPIAKGALGKLWFGIAAVALAAGGLAWATLPASETVQVVKAGTGPSPTTDDVVLISYKGTLSSNGKVFDENPQLALPVDGGIVGFTRALLKMQRGGKYKLHIPANLAYGNQARPGIPANSDLDFDVELLDFKSKAEIEAQMQQMRAMQQMQQMQGGKGGAGAAIPPGAEGAPISVPGQ